MLRAECYKQRMEKGLSFLEFNYMIMQSYDFYELYRKYGCNLQFGGDDQWSNMLGGRELIRRKLGLSEEAAFHLDEINKWAYDNGKYPNSYNIREFYYPDSAKKAFPDNVTADLTKADK